LGTEGGVLDGDALSVLLIDGFYNPATIDFERVEKLLPNGFCELLVRGVVDLATDLTSKGGDPIEMNWI
jgi:hypothetical protein